MHRSELDRWPTESTPDTTTGIELDTDEDDREDPDPGAMDSEVDRGEA